HDGSQQLYCRWSKEEDLLLSKAVARYGAHKWTLVSSYIPGRTAIQCSTRWFGALNSNVHKGKWSKKEDKLLIESVNFFQMITKSDPSTLPWSQISESIPFRTGIQCQSRWTEALDPAIRKGRWSPEEDRQLGSAVAQYGCCWIRVSSLIPTRTQRQCRTRWNQIHCKNAKTPATVHNSKDGLPINSNKEASEYPPNQDKDSLFDNPFTSLSAANLDYNFMIPQESILPSFNYKNMLPNNAPQDSQGLTVDEIIVSNIPSDFNPLKSASINVRDDDSPKTPILSHQDQHFFNNNTMQVWDDFSFLNPLLDNTPIGLSNTGSHHKSYNL
ncbi:Myb-like DNA-binding domain protein, partial [Rhizopus stolonifer]